MPLSIAEYFIEQAEECFRLSRFVHEIAKEMEATGNKFLAKATEIDTKREKTAEKG